MSQMPNRTLRKRSARATSAIAMENAGVTLLKGDLTGIVRAAALGGEPHAATRSCDLFAGRTSPSVVDMPSFRSLCALLAALALVLGTMIPVAHGSMAHDKHGTSISTAMDPMAADCDRCSDNAAVPISCAKVFCAGSAMVPILDAKGSPEAAAAQFRPALDLDGSGLTPFPDFPPPRTILIG